MSGGRRTDIKQEYIEAAIKQRDSSYSGDSKIANKQYRILKRIYKQIEEDVVDRKILLELLNNDNISVRGWAAAHMLGLGFEVALAEKELERIAVDPGMVGFSAKMTLKTWKQGGHLKLG